MAAVTLENPMPLQQALNGDSAEHEIQDAKPKAEKQQNTGDSDEMASSGIDNPEEKITDDKGQEEEKNEDEADNGEEQEQEEESEKENGDMEEKKESEPATPATGSDRPTRERKSVERYTTSSPHKFPRYSGSATNTFSIDQGTGTQLKDIPNVAFKLSKRKPDDNLRALHNILFGKKAKAQTLKRNIGMFSGYVWAENEQEKQRTKIKEKIEKCVKEKLVDFCDVLNIQINKSGKKEDMAAKLLEFLESPHATTDVLLADKVKKGKKRATKKTKRKSSGKSSESPPKKQKKTSQAGKKRKQSSDIEEDDSVELSDATIDSQEDGEDVTVPKDESGRDVEESQSEEEEDKTKANMGPSQKTEEEDKSTTVKTSTVKSAKSNEKTQKKSTSKKTDTDKSSASISKSKQNASKKQKTVSEDKDSKGKTSNKKQSHKFSKGSVKDQGKGSSNKKAKTEPTSEELHAVAVDMLKKVDFNTVTLSDIVKQLGNHFGLDLMHRKAEVRKIITDVIKNMDDEEEAENLDDSDDNNDDDDANDNDDAEKDDE